MKNISIKECRVWSYRPTKFWINITLQIKSEDITKDEKDLLEELRKNGDSLVWVLQEFAIINDDKQNIRNKKLARLSILMNDYAKASNLSIETIKDELYKRKNITSRSDLKLEDIEIEIEGYKYWILEYNNGIWK